MPKKKKSQNYWTKENFIKECEKYNSYHELRHANKSAVEAARSKGYLDEIIDLLGWEKRRQRINGRMMKWTKEMCLESASRYTTKIAWSKNDPNAHSASLRNGWYKECTKHMSNLINKRDYWTKERCIENALQYQVKEKWKKERWCKTHIVCYLYQW